MGHEGGTPASGASHEAVQQVHPRGWPICRTWKVSGRRVDLFPNRVVIDPSALAHNLRQVRSVLEDGVGITAVVKADAYGHGMRTAAEAFLDAGAERLAVAHVAEAVTLRESGVRGPIVILCGVHTRKEAAAVLTYDLIPVLSDFGPVDLLGEESRRRGTRVRVQLKIDTGMGRLGIPYTETGAFLDKALAQAGLEPEGLVSHLSSADESDRDFTEAQIRRYAEALETARSRGARLEASSLANSAGVLWYPEARQGMVRPGIVLYGGLPSPGRISPITLRPAMTLSARVLQVRNLPAGTPVSYGRTYTTPGERKTAVISAGYSDGLPRSLSNRGRVLIRGQKLPIVGRVCMNLVMADVTGLEDVVPGDEAVFLGSQGNATITGDEVAEPCGTIAYEIYCAVGRCGEKANIP